MKSRVVRGLLTGVSFFVAAQFTAAEEAISFSYDLEGDTTYLDAFNSVLKAHSKPPEEYENLFEMTWFRNGNLRNAEWTRLKADGTVRTASHIWNTRIQGGEDRKPLSADELDDVKTLLETLPDSAGKTPAATLLLINYLSKGKRIVRAYDRSAPPDAILKLNKILQSRLESGPSARGDVPHEWEMPATQMDEVIYLSHKDAGIGEVARDLETKLGRSIVLDPKLLEQTPRIITINFEHIPLYQALNQFTARLNANLYFTRGIYWISKDSPAEVLPDELELPQLNDSDARLAADALRDLQSDDFNTRESGAATLISKGPAVLKSIMTAKEESADLDFQTRQSRIEETLRSKLRDGTPSVRLKILLRKSYSISGELSLKWAARGLARQMHRVPVIEFEDQLAEKVVSLPQIQKVCGYAAFEIMARAAGCRLQIRGNKVRFVTK